MPDFGIFRGFNEKLFGNKLYAGQLPTQLGLIGSEDFAFDADAQAFITAAGITDATQQAAINTLVINLKGYGIWSKMKAIYPFVGGTASTHKYNLKDPRDLDAAFRLVFNGGWTHSSTGATPNGTNGYADTKLNISTHLSLTNTHLSYYSRTNVQNSSFGAEIGILGTYSVSAYMALRTRNSLPSGTAYFTIGQDNGAGLSSTNGSGLTTGSATSLTSRKLYKNSSLIATQTTSNTGSLPNFNAALGMNANGSYGSNESSFASIGDGLSDTEASNLYTAVQAFQTSLSRQV